MNRERTHLPSKLWPPHHFSWCIGAVDTWTKQICMWYTFLLITYFYLAWCSYQQDIFYHNHLDVFLFYNDTQFICLISWSICLLCFGAQWLYEATFALIGSLLGIIKDLSAFCFASFVDCRWEPWKVHEFPLG